MKSINVSFSYDGKDYKFSAKFKYEKSKPKLTEHKCNGQISYVRVNGDWNIYDHNTDIEVVIDGCMESIENVILWDINVSGSAPIAMLGEFDNYKGEIKGLW